MKNQELEVKFFITDLKKIERIAQSSGSVLTQPRTYESNLRFDTPDRRLQSNLQVLRLRLDSEARLTFKGQAQSFGGARLREEIEFVASDYETARLFLLALGFEVVMVYEKYRTVYDLENVHITLDELPYGNFLELEGDDPQILRKISLLLGVDWEAQASGSYAYLFEQLKLEHGFPFRDLTFENFGNLTITPEMLHLKPAD
jgi:adenylate cyclase, class 2